MFASEYRPAATKRLLWVVVVLCAVICAQTVSISQEHSHQHSAHHCCGLCHTGPLPFVPMSMDVAALQPSAVTWFTSSDECDGVLERLASVESSRAPPA